MSIEKVEMKASNHMNSGAYGPLRSLCEHARAV